MATNTFIQEEVLFKENANRLNGFLAIYAQRGNLILTSKLLCFSSGWKGKSYELSVDELFVLKSSDLTI